MILGKDNIARLPPPVGTSDWATFSRDSYCVDKTLMIKDLIDARTRVALFTRPRRFGKTTASVSGFYDEMCTFMSVFLSGALKDNKHCHLGLMTGVLRVEFRILSNAESGEGRFDIALKPLVEPFPAFIIEVKKADSPDDDLKSLAREARAQIDGKKYDAAFRAEGLADIEKIGLAYCKNKVEICR